MAPKKPKKIKTKSKRYSCDLCSEIDNALMIQCYECQSKYHMKCIGVVTVDNDNKWLCSECQKAELSRNTKQNQDALKSLENDSKSKSSQNENGPQSNVPPGHQSNVPPGHQSNVNDCENKFQNQDRASLRTSQQSQGTRSSTRRRAEIELERLEEERKLKELRDKEYLDSKYKILLEVCSSRSDYSRSERHSTDRSSFTKEWVQSTSLSKPSQVPSRIRQTTDNMNQEGRQRFEKRIDNITFDNTSIDPHKRKAVVDLSKRLNREYLNDLAALHSTEKVEQQPNPISSASQQSQQPSMLNNNRNQLEMNGQSNRERIPCPTHDARKFMFQDRFTSKQNGHIGMPCSNSTFAAPQKQSTNVMDNRDNEQQMNTASTQNTLEWDNFFEVPQDWDFITPQPNRSTSINQNTRSSAIKGHQSNSQNNQNTRSSAIHSHQSDFENRGYDDETISVSNDEKFQSEFEHEPPPRGSYAFDNSQSKSSQHQFTSNRRSEGDQNYRRVKFDESQQQSRGRSSVLSMENRPQSSYTSTSNMNRELTQSQIAARHVVERKLPIFTGDPLDWQIWYHQYTNSTELCGYTDGENIGRLQKSIQGIARDAVKGRLIHASSVPWIIDTLKTLYGRPELIIKTIIDKIRDHPPVKSDRMDELIEFAFEVQTIYITIDSLECANHLPDPMLIEALVDKLPTQEKKDWAIYKAGRMNVTLKTLAEWLYNLAKILSTVTSPRSAKSNNRKPEKEKFERNVKTIGLERVNVHVSQTSKNAESRGRKQAESTQSKRVPCLICKGNCNRVEECSKFKSSSVDARWDLLSQHNLCRKCLKKHKGPCRETIVCGKDGCQFKHHLLLHNDERYSPKKNNSTQNETIASSNLHAAINTSTMLRMVPVILYNGIKQVATFAFLDDGTTVTMMENWLATELGLNGTSEQICLIWTKNIHRRERAQRVSLEISGIGDFNKRYLIRGVRTVDDLNLPAQTMKREELIAEYPYLKNVPFVNYENATPGIMIGSDIPKLGTQLQIIESEDVEKNDFNGPMASRTRLGWSIHGPQSSSTNNEYVNVHHIEVCPHHNELDNEIHQRVKDYFSIENFGVQASSKTILESKDDERALNMLEKLTKKKNGRYETGLLWKNENTILPDSYPMALKRLISLERQGKDVIKILGAKIADYVAKGYARKLSVEELNYKGPVWYLPPFGVVHPKKPEKLRMVFDAAAKVKSISLNSVLLKGPDLYTSLVDILRRFRERLFTGGGDIFEMYHQVFIREQDRHFQRFLFRDDCNKRPTVYQLEVMTFGAVCSPSAAQFVKNKNAAEFKETHPKAVCTIIDNHYVDDMMDCEHTEEEMIKLITDVKMIHARGGFKIRNFISNSEKVLNAVGEMERNNVKDITPKTELKVERVLGMWYNTKTDIFTFSLKYTPIEEEIFTKNKLPTKREILRILMSIFDPLGLLSNFLIYLKIILQDVWRTQIDWDEQISQPALVERWNSWLEILPQVEKVKVPRLYSPKMSPNEPKSIQMHVFVDASEDAFSAVIYFRVEDENGTECTLAGSKARVAPLKYLSIPRMELQGGILGSRLATSIQNSQRFKINKRVFWTDSATVLSWLNSDHRKYSQFVAHRVGEILENSDVNEWRWIPTKENVADEATKWSKTPNFESTNRWFSGPEFLRLSEEYWPEKKQIKIDVEEEMKAHFAHSSFLSPRIINAERFSKYKRMVRALAYAIRFVNLLTGRAKKGEPLSQNELRRAEQLIFRQAQFEGYPAEMVTLERNKTLPINKQKFIEKPSPLYDGTPYLDADGILRMKGRIDGARELSMETRRPIILPKDSHVTKLLLLQYHSEFFHQNHETIVNEVRQKFYIPRLRAVLKKARNCCQLCKVKKTHPIPPQMADLPNARLAVRFIPYSFVGIDFFGPMYVTVGRRKEKRWGVLFTCLTIRAIHIEISPGLDTNSCILCIQNFVADHGPVIEFHSDCGTNFKGTDNQLQLEMSKIDPERLSAEFTFTYTKWIFNPPASPHFGGAWERLIRIVKSAIDEVMPTRTPKEDMLRNLLKQIQNVVNSRPLTFIPLDVEEDEALTPNHFIKLSSNGSKPPCEIELDGPNLRESWKEAQRLTELFWKRFVKEYLPTLARRTKWHKPALPLKEGDLVLIVDENNPRNTYPKARIISTKMGSNNQVRRVKVEIISGTVTNSKGQIIKVKKSGLWRSAHKLALLDVAAKNSLAEPNSKTGGSVDATKMKSNIGAPGHSADQVTATESRDFTGSSSDSEEGR